MNSSSLSTTRPIEMPFDPSTLDETQKADFDAYLQQQIADANKSIETNRNTVLEEKRAVEEQAKQSKQTLEQYQQSFGEMTPEEVTALIKAQQDGDIAKLIGENKLEEATEAKATLLVKEQQRVWDAKFGDQNKTIEELTAKYETADKQNREHRLGKFGVETYMKLDDHRPTAIGDVNDAILANFSLDEQGDPLMYEKDGKTIKLDPKGKPVTIEYFVNEMLRDTKPHYFKDKDGSGAPGSRGTNSSDFGLGISQRKGVSDEQRAKFFAACREKGVDNPTEKWNAIPWENAA